MKSLTLAIFSLCIFIPEIALAQSSASTVLCNVYWYINGPVGSAIAMLGVISLGVVSMFGKIQISSVLTIMAGIALIFGAPQILIKLDPDLTLCDIGSNAQTIYNNVIKSDMYVILACVITWFLGPMGKALASLSLIVIGLFATFGKISWHQAIVVAVGIATIFGTVSIVSTLGVPVYGKDAAGGLSKTFRLIDACSDGGFSLDVMLCNVIRMITGPVGQGIVTTGLVIVGLGALFGKVSWIISLVFALGTALIFGAENIIESIGVPEQINCTAEKKIQRF